MSFSHDDFMQAQATIADLERQLAEAQTENDRLEGIQQQAQELILMAEDYRDDREEAQGRWRHDAGTAWRLYAIVMMVANLMQRQRDEAEGKINLLREFAEVGCADLERDRILAILGEKGA